MIASRRCHGFILNKIYQLQSNWGVSRNKRQFSWMSLSILFIYLYHLRIINFDWCLLHLFHNWLLFACYGIIFWEIWLKLSFRFSMFSLYNFRTILYNQLFNTFKISSRMMLMWQTKYHRLSFGWDRIHRFQRW